MRSSALGWVAVAVAGLGLACANTLVGPDPSSTPAGNFDALWTEFDRLYSLFPLKGVDWDSVYGVYRPQVDAVSTDRQLFDVMAAMLETLDDGHVYLIAPFAGVASNAPAAVTWKTNFDAALITGYLGSSARSAGGGRFRYGEVAPGIGYLYIATFEDEDFKRIDDWARDIDTVMAAVAGDRALIVDVRSNGGGDAFNAQYIADRFADRERLFAYGMSRDGPAHDDFTAPFAWYERPDGPRQFTGPIALLTNRWTASAAERFALALRVLPNVTFVGDTTQGAFPHAVPRELPNGWLYRVTVGVVVGPDRESYEGVGIPPDVAVNLAPADSAAGRDTILETAIALLANGAR
jgi:Peptidase family S41/Tricorn protease C1 domain